MKIQGLLKKNEIFMDCHRELCLEMPFNHWFCVRDWSHDRRADPHCGAGAIA